MRILPFLLSFALSEKSKTFRGSFLMRKEVIDAGQDIEKPNFGR
jgi:hypothetical protein